MVALDGAVADGGPEMLGERKGQRLWIGAWLTPKSTSYPTRVTVRNLVAVRQNV